MHGEDEDCGSNLTSRTRRNCLTVEQAQRVAARSEGSFPQDELGAPAITEKEVPCHELFVISLW